MNKIIEYMSFGKSIVAFDLLEHRRSALESAHYVECNDIKKFAVSMRELLEDNAQRQRMGAFARNRFQHVLAWELAEETLIRAYQRLFNAVDLASLQHAQVSLKPTIGPRAFEGPVDQATPAQVQRELVQFE